MISLEGKRVLITGGAVRLGAVLCHSFAKRGASVLIHCLNSKREAESLRSILPHPERHRIVVRDLSDADAATEMIRCAGELDVLVNNAARWLRHPASPEEEAEQMRVNCETPIAMIREFARHVVSDDACAINILDQLVFRPDEEDRSAYAESKRALARATRELAAELAPAVRVNAVAPGPVFPPKELKCGGMVLTPRRLPLLHPVVPEELAETVVFLSSLRSATGAIIPVDCGQSLAHGKEFRL